MRWLCALLVMLGLAAPVCSAEDPAVAAEQAAAQLQAAADGLAAAQKASDRVKALTETVRAYEAGLQAMREGLRRVTRRETALTQQLQAREGEVADLIGVITTIETSTPPVLMLHPSGPLGAARSAMMLAEVTPGLQARADALKGDLQEVQELRLLQMNAAQQLEKGLDGAQTARIALSTAMADRQDLPQRYIEDPVQTAILMSSADTLTGFADGLAMIAEAEDLPESDGDISARRGSLALPVQGILLRGYGQRDAAGIARPGFLIATRPRALVTSPTAATIRYRGPLLDLGNVVILEPQADMLLVVSGLAEVFGDVGQVIPEGTPIGLMGGETPEAGTILPLSGEGAGTDRTETLYIEIRMENSPVDPATWFRTGQGG
ncbi:Membrane-bound metallopeptidase [Tritonibacter multivorans]|uniref:Membrane-bound metallopeptidase n=1 Tax=Tritonibacter multivorans TaxID=928856 RepID=A0A0P1GEF6_9RHOB|nr:peptidoglycan DD-metalloendopeptidase family protein [Tritonibacter multivorans]MDA7420255.1 peptidoglycan DD-metalloendopeptidase family protein [Tritonibacter multivorans]CUH79978.1 Membrane-bound metallopeptidase [Tritonibacter multivorans]SFB98172.1 Septal ring factor EnvC, activator of murein hydrolases AmiA and AmiB [Tritonibacter multivorans]